MARRSTKATDPVVDEPVVDEVLADAGADPDVVQGDAGDDEPDAGDELVEPAVDDEPDEPEDVTGRTIWPGSI
jgi:hypothetical protein